jgi:hypothetical protein
MTPGDLVITVEFTTEPDEKTAFLSGLYANGGVIKPNFARDNYDYTIAVPFGTEGFSISAQAENPYLEPELRQLSPESGDKELDDELTLVEGLNEYTITVTSQDTKTTQTYNIKAIKLPDLSLQTFQITRAENSFERDLAHFDTQPVYVSYADGITVVAEAADSGADVNISPASTPSLKVDVPTAVTVTVKKDLPGVAEEYKTKNYILNLYYGSGVPPNPLAEGGIVSFIPAETPGSYYEVHTFLESGTLSFFDKSAESLKAGILIVAGGGGAGAKGDNRNNIDCAGGGGSGGLLYKPGFDLPANSNLTVTVGSGGKGGTYLTSERGVNGIASQIEGGSVNLTAPGGGGGGNGNGYNTSNVNGLAGGSGGGGGASTINGSGGASTAGASGALGNVGGSSGMDNGGSGGGAGGNGASNGGAGGLGWKPADNNALWLQTVTGAAEFSHGGRGGPTGGSLSGDNYGDGGSAGSINQTGGAGHSGIVIIRFPHPGNEDEE